MTPPAVVRTAIILTIVTSSVFVYCDVCTSINIRNNPIQLETLRNCTIIDGHLKMLLMELSDDHSDFNDHRFPKLVDITDHLIVYRIFKLHSLRYMFPNLRRIGGKETFKGYSLVIYDLPDLKEIGLNNLIRIGRGGVMVDHCPNLCFADTVNWTAIGATKISVYKTNPNLQCEFCPRHCPEGCWDTHMCQKTDEELCHDECLGCHKPNSSQHCKVCKLWKDDNTCVPSCPKHKFKFDVSKRCVTEEECSKFWNFTGWTFDGNCINTCPPDYVKDDSVPGKCKFCGDKCVKVCNGKVVDNQASMETLYRCTHIKGSLEIRMTDPWYINKLSKFCGRIVEISGHLKIGRSGLNSLKFLKSLKLIKGEEGLENKQFALVVYENENLEELFDFNSNNFSLKILRGSISLNGNPRLCFPEIERFVKLSKIKLSQDETNFLRNSNGYRSVCHTRDFNVTVMNVGSNYANITWEMFNEDSIAYTIYFIEASSENITEFDSEETCDMKWESFLVSRNYADLLNLKPFTKYGFYVSSYSYNSKQDFQTQQTYQTSIHYFTTLEGDPSEPRDFEILSFADNFLRLHWTRPKYPSGIIDYYEVTVLLQPDYVPMIRERNYCKDKHVSGSERVTIIESPINNTTNPNCSCEIIVRRKVYGFLQNGGSAFCSPGSTETGCNELQYGVYDPDLGNNISEPLYASRSQVRTIQKKSLMATVERNEINNTSSLSIIINNGTATEFDVVNLRHFSLYIFFLRACNKVNDSGGERSLCSPVVMSSGRTARLKTADEISTLHVINEGTDVIITWRDPPTPNSIVVAYDIEHKRNDAEHPKTTTECMPKTEYDSKFASFRISDLSPGHYSVRVRAISYAGPGVFSHSKDFVISSPTPKTWIYVLVAVLIAATIIGAALWYYRRRRIAFNNIHLITSINPDYAGSAYVADEWEIERSDVEVLQKLGKGSFGMVHQGLIKSRNYSVAIKLANEANSFSEREMFLHEGSVMKTFKDAHHVVRLVGIVSRGQPPMVIMELMERGDLKSYLRRCREPSQNLTTNEIYRMAANIADGMAYLAAKKYVHRDLAARNCMVGADHTVKIGDFGMARDVYETDYYRKETMGLLPVRWMAPESLSDGVFTSDSDVWAYGVVLWEMATLAEQPYQGYSNEEVFRLVKTKGKLDRPPECSDLLYEVMDACWMWRPIDRPTFRDIVDRLVTHVGESFRLVAFCYSRHGRETAITAGPRQVNAPAMVTLPEDVDNDNDADSDSCQEEVHLFPEESSRSAKYYPKPHQRTSKSPPHTFDLETPSTSSQN